MNKRSVWQIEKFKRGLKYIDELVNYLKPITWEDLERAVTRTEKKFMTSWDEQIAIIENEITKKIEALNPESQSFQEETEKGKKLLERLQKVRKKYEKWNINEWKTMKKKRGEL